MIPSWLFLWLTTYKYAIVFLLAIVEGPILMVISGMLFHLGFFSFWPIYLTLILGDLTADFGWYAVGYFGAKKFIQRFGRFFSINETIVEKIENLFQKHHNKILFISKITMGFGFALATLIAAGMSRVSLKKYGFFNLVGGFIWTGFLFSLGYFFGNLYSRIAQGFKLIFLFAAAVVVVAALYGFNKYMRSRFIKNQIINPKP